MERKTLHYARQAFFIVMLLPFALFAQQKNEYPKNYFRWPLNLKPDIVANFGELRPNHWHMGLDIRTRQKENQPVYAAAAGYIAKIRVEKSGFGQCIWINHPNGLTTLYAHLNAFFPALEKFVRDQQYKQETWAIELDFPKEKFPVSKGQFIAYSGNTGGSQGPHLHFEIRDTKTDECLNPLLFGLPLTDNVPPTLLKLAMYDRSGSIYEQTTSYFPLKKESSGYVVLKTPVIKTGLDKISFAIQAFDRISGSKNEDGIFSAQLFFDDEPVIGFSFDSISYKETGYLNAHIDYKYRYNGGVFFQHLSQLPGNHSGVYHAANGDGVIRLADTSVHAVRIEIKDAYRNKTQLNFFVQHNDEIEKPARHQSAAQQFLPNYVNVLEKPDFEIYLPEICLYDTLRSFYNKVSAPSEFAVSSVHQVNDPSAPVHDDLVVRMKADKTIPVEWRDKIIIQRSYRNTSSPRKAVMEGEWLSAKFSDFGNFQAFADVIPPTIQELGKGDTVDLSPAKRIVFQPVDNFGVIKGFRAELDGKWLRFTNDKGWAHIYVFDEHCRYGKHHLKVTVEDLAGNITTKNWWFKKYPYKPPKKKPTKKSSKTKTTTKKPGGKTTSTKKK
ncbi:MAG: peptidoglycan DD-metalloendopeptidase family protein [Chitinophagales bacterium]